MSARYTRSDRIKTAITALVVGMATGALCALPAVVAVPVLCIGLYWFGVLDGRAGRRGAWVIDLISRAPRAVAGVFRRPQGGQS